ncbi:hemicentin-1-like [Branchiostoma floridae x Branchiostoma japonicum]
MRTYVGFALAIAVLFIASPVEGGKKPQCDAMDYTSEKVDCTSCTYNNVAIDPPTATYKKKTVCTCECYFGCVRDSGKAVRECAIRPRRWKPSPRLQCSCRSCAAPTLPFNYASSNCSGTVPFGTICVFECQAGYVPEDGASDAENRRQYCEDSNWKWTAAAGCIRHGEWSDWVDGECSATCGGGTMTRTRTCDNPEPDGGDECTRGDSTETTPEDRTETITDAACNEDPCQTTVSPTGEVPTVLPTGIA